MQEIQDNFAFTPNMIDGIGFCAKSFDKDSKLITEEVITSNSKKILFNKIMFLFW